MPSLWLLSFYLMWLLCSVCLEDQWIAVYSSEPSFQVDFSDYSAVAVGILHPKLMHVYWYSVAVHEGTTHGIQETRIIMCCSLSDDALVHEVI